MSRKVLSLAALLIAAAALAGCSRVYSTEISGYVKDAGTTLGVTGATVRFYLTEPAAADSEGFIAETASGYNLQIPGWFDREIMWESSSPMFGDEGDSIPLWISATHPDFQPAVISVEGVVSGGQNVVPDIALSRVWFYAVTVTGAVFYGAGAPAALIGKGANNAEVVLDLTPDDGSEQRDFVTTTYTYVPSSGSPIPGTYTFINVKWNNSTPNSAGSDTHAARIYVTTPYGDQNVEVTLTSGQVPNVLDPIVTP